MLIPEYKFDHSTTIMNLGDVHRGNVAFDKELFRRCVERIKKDDRMYWLSTGDLLEVALKDSIGDVYTAMNPECEFYQLIDELEPIKHKFLGLVESNHHHRFAKSVGMSLDRLLVETLFGRHNAKGLYLGPFGVIKVTCGAASYYIGLTHGTGGGKMRGGKVNNTARLVEILGGCDIYMNGHTHTYNNFPSLIYFLDKKRGRLTEMQAEFVTTGHFLKYFESYGVGKYIPAPEGAAMVSLKHSSYGRQSAKKVVARLYN